MSAQAYKLTSESLEVTIKFVHCTCMNQTLWACSLLGGRFIPHGQLSVSCVCACVYLCMPVCVCVSVH
jgi:hypothetical protein